MATMTNRSTMHPIAQWIVWFGLGVANALLVGIGGVIVVVILLVLAVRLAFRGDPLAASSGLCVGLGMTWLALMARQASTGGRLDDAGSWLALGSIPTVVGVMLGVLRLVHWAKRPDLRGQGD